MIRHSLKFYSIITKNDAWYSNPSMNNYSSEEAYCKKSRNNNEGTMPQSLD
jgi:hypothetical protein